MPTSDSQPTYQAMVIAWTLYALAAACIVGTAFLHGGAEAALGAAAFGFGLAAAIKGIVYAIQL